ncbi:MAG: methionyl-tRNA formyltransferase [Deltaproteobacteria bacterium]|nr:methionyl-tRNA formyltransferase [Deltaproteobacteria bacterium]
MNQPKIVYLGSPEIAVPCLEALHRMNFPILEVWCQPDKPQGRGQKIDSPAVKIKAIELGLPVFQPSKVDQTCLSHLQQLKPDVIVVVAYGHRLPNEVIRMPELGCINVHFSLLPRWRGAACVAQAILNGDAETGVSTMFIQEGPVDSGPILLQKSLSILPEDTTQSLSLRLATLAPEILLKTLAGLLAKTLVFKAQDENHITYAPKIKKEDGKINWQQDCRKIYHLVRAMFPWPGAFSFFKNKKVILNQVTLCQDRNLGSIAPGVLKWVKNQGLWVACNPGFLKIEKILPEGKREMSGEEFARGYCHEKNSTFHFVS